MDSFLKRFKFLQTSGDLLVAISVVLILAMMIIPIHPLFLDFSLVSGLSLSVVILLMSIYIKRPLEFSTFPALLLVMTLLRLSLNIASTRNILLHGGSEGTDAAGQIIRAFGEFVVRGNYVVGIIVFITLVIINFMVITKGAGRVAEVAARFTLDAMPGKQMAIDADLNAGLISDKEAKERRREIAEEADFYGAMDGASKFVRGDAIASLLITLINIMGGIIVGVFQDGLPLSGAAEIFTLLTIGDGLVSQVPALIISTAAGVMITRNTNENNFGHQVVGQFKLHPKALYLASLILMVFAPIPGLPALPFAVVAGILGFIGHRVEKSKEEQNLAMLAQKAGEREKEEGHLENLLDIELVEIEVGYGLISLVDSEQNGDLLERLTSIRKQFVLDKGIIIPSIRIRDNLEIKPGEYVIKIKGIEVGRGELMLGHVMAMDPEGEHGDLEGAPTVEPVFGLPAMWILEKDREQAQYDGHTVVDLSTIMATHLTELLKRNLPELFGREELVNLMDHFKKTHPKIINDLVPDILTLGPILKVLQNLLKENISIRDLRTIFETLAECGVSIKDTDLLTERVRQALFRTITESVKSKEGDIPLFTLDRKIEDSISEALPQSDGGVLLALDPKITQSILVKLNEKIDNDLSSGDNMIVLCSPHIRSHFKRLIEKFIPSLIVISHNELSSDAKIRSLGTVRL